MKNQQLVSISLAAIATLGFVVSLGGIWGAVDPTTAWQMLLSATTAAIFVSIVSKLASEFFASAGK